MNAPRDPAGSIKRTLVAVFFLSGMDGLLYQVTWQRLLTIHYGVGPISTTLIVTVFMLGLGLGALAGGFLAERVGDRLRAYLFVELLLGGFGLLSLPYLDLLGRATAGGDFLASSLGMFLFLCVPTLLMGMTLPLIVKVFSGWSDDFLDTVSFLYFVNTLGAAAGALVASYGVLSFLGLDRCIYIAAAINLGLAGLIATAGRSAGAPGREGPSPASPPTPASPPAAGGMGRMAWPAVLVTGFLAIGYEITWFRMVEVLVKASPYAFSTVLAVYLLGTATGSFAMHRALRRSRVGDRRSLFFLLQFLIGAYVGLFTVGYYYLTRDTPLRELTRLSFANPLHPSFEAASIGTPGAWLADLDILLWPLPFVFVPTLLIGASFPLISSLALSEADREGRTVGTVYFFNTMGNVLGGVATGFLLLPHLRTERTLLAFVAVNLMLGLFVVRLRGRAIPPIARLAAVGSLVVAAALAFPGPGQLYRAMHFPPGPGYRASVEEGVEGVVVTYRDGDRVVNYINGLSHGGRPNPLFQAETFEALKFAREPRNVLVIGFGTGLVTEVAERHPGVRRITLVEVNDTLMGGLGRIPALAEILADPRLRVVIDDGRRFLLRTDERFDAILIDPLRTTTAYSNNLYSRQFFALLGRHLAPGGVLLAWTDELRVMPRTIHAVFPDLRCYAYNDRAGFVVASDSPLRPSPGADRDFLATFSAAEREAIGRLPIRFLGDQGYVERQTRGYPVNEDWRPACEYYLGLKARAVGPPR